MRNTLVIARRELEEKRFVGIAVLAFAALPFLLAAIPGISAGSPRNVIGMAAMLLSIGFTLGLALILGSSFVLRDLTEGRMSFYFSRPVAPAAIWFGKLLSALVLIAVSFFVIAVPARIAVGADWNRVWPGGVAPTAGIVLSVAATIFFIAHVIGTWARSRSPVIALDFAAAVGCGIAIRLLIRPLLEGSANHVVEQLATGLSIAALVALVGGGAWQLERGRTNRKRNHHALSQFVWSVMGVALLVSAAFVVWITSVKPDDLINVNGWQSAGGSWAVLTGTARSRSDYRAAFLMNTDDGSSVRMDPQGALAARFSRDGKTAFWPVPDGREADLYRFRTGDARPVKTGVTMDLIAVGLYGFQLPRGSFVPSDDGSRIAVIDRDLLSVYDVAGTRSVGSARLPRARAARAFLMTPDLIRLYLDQSTLQIAEYDVRARMFRMTGAVTDVGDAGFWSVTLDGTGTRMLLRTAVATMLCDARTGALLHTLVNAHVSAARFLRDGRIAVIEHLQDAIVLRLFSPDGGPLRDINIGRGKSGYLLGDDGTHVVVATTNAVEFTWTLHSVDVSQGVVAHSERARAGFLSGFGDRPAIQPVREVLYRDTLGALRLWSPSTGLTRPLTGG